MASLKPCQEKPSGKKSMTKEKSIEHVYFSSSFRQSSLRCRSPILWINSLKFLLGNDFVKMSARFSHKRTCGHLYHLSPLMYPFFNWAIQASLSSYIIVGVNFSTTNSHVTCTCWTTDLSQIHTRLASCNAKISVCYGLFHISPWNNCTSTCK